jgi:hypothetical protein
MKPRIFLLACSLLAVAILFAALWLGRPRPVPSPCPVDDRPQTIEKLQIGMHEREVVALLGAPAGDYRTDKTIGFHFDIDGPLPPGPGEAVEKDWLTDEWMIRVWFGPDGTVVYGHSGKGCPPPARFESLMDDLRRYLPFLP